MKSDFFWNHIVFNEDFLCIIILSLIEITGVRHRKSITLLDFNIYQNFTVVEFFPVL